MSEYNDKEIKCSSCGDKFIFEAGEQKFFEMKGFPEPKRCSDCRAERKRASEKYNK